MGQPGEELLQLSGREAVLGRGPEEGSGSDRNGEEQLGLQMTWV